MATTTPEPTLAQLATEFGYYQADIFKKVLCCEPNEALRQLMLEVTPMMRVIRDKMNTAA